jgi:hypothetical protein
MQAAGFAAVIALPRRGLMKNGFAAIACSLLAAACAAPEQNDSREYRAPVYRTGSNIPRDRETLRSDDKRELSAEERRMIEEMQTRSRQPPPGTSK